MDHKNFEHLDQIMHLKTAHKFKTVTITMFNNNNNNSNHFMVTVQAAGTPS